MVRLLSCKETTDSLALDIGAAKNIGLMKLQESL